LSLEALENIAIGPFHFGQIGHAIDNLDHNIVISFGLGIDIVAGLILDIIVVASFSLGLNSLAIGLDLGHTLPPLVVTFWTFWTF